MTTIGALKSDDNHAAGAPKISPPINVLVAGSEQRFSIDLQQFLSERGFRVTVVRDGAAALDRLRAEQFDVALLDLALQKFDAVQILDAVREDPSAPQIIVLSAKASVESSAAARKAGAYEVVGERYRGAEIEALVRRAWEKRLLTRDNAQLQSRLRHLQPEKKFVTQYAGLQAILALVRRVASSLSPVLISGEFGTGKDLVATLLHTEGERANAPFVEFICTDLSEANFERELFGIERDALPGGNQQSPGLLELAADGTLYLNSIGNLTVRLQTKLLSVLEDRSFNRVGGSHAIPFEARVVASTNRDLPRMAATGLFRDDLLQHISTVRVSLPPLRERSVDIALLAEHFVSKFGGSNAPRLTDAAMGALERYRWPGNVRELRNVIERAVLLARNGFIEPSDLPLDLNAATAQGAPLLPSTLAELERRHIQAVLDQTGWHQGHASLLLGISAKTLYRKIREYGFRRPTKFAGPLDGN